MKDDVKKTVKHIFRAVERNRLCSMVSRAEREAEEAKEQQEREQEDKNE